MSGQFQLAAGGQMQLAAHTQSSRVAGGNRTPRLPQNRA